DGLRSQCRRPRALHGPRPDRRAGLPRSDFRGADPRAHPCLHRPDPEALGNGSFCRGSMTSWDRFVDTFFNGRVMLKSLPDVLHGVVVTVELAVLIVLSGLFAGLILALLRSLAVRPMNWLIVFLVDLFRSLPPLVIIVLIYFGLPAA